MTTRRKILASLGGFSFGSMLAWSQRPRGSPSKPPKKKRKRGGKKARGHEEGTLKVGDVAPGFNLKILKSEERVHLASFAGKQPVALVFGSYT